MLTVTGSDLRMMVSTAEPGTEDAERLALLLVLGTQTLVGERAAPSGRARSRCRPHLGCGHGQRAGEAPTAVDGAPTAQGVRPYGNAAVPTARERWWAAAGGRRPDASPHACTGR